MRGSLAISARTSSSMCWVVVSMLANLRLGELGPRTILRRRIRVAYAGRRPVRPPVAQEDLDRRGDGDGEERAEDPEQRRAHQDGEDRDDGVDLQRVAVDDRLDKRVLDALVDDDEGDPDDRGGREVDRGGGDGDEDRAERRADQRDEVEEA